jgi:hypothetical protein
MFFDLDAFKTETKNLIDRLLPVTDNIGVVSYNHNATDDYILGSDMNAAKAAVDTLIP